MSQPPKTQLQSALFTEQRGRLYAVLDGASVPELLSRLKKWEPPHVCLYRGQLKPDLAACAPYLVQLGKDSMFTDWMLDNALGKHWGIFAFSRADLIALRKHFRTFLMVKTHLGKSVYFRFYDPRVLSVYLPTCNADECKVLFGSIAWFLAEAAEGRELVRFTRSAAGLSQHRMTIC